MTLLLQITLHFSITALVVLIFKRLLKSKLSARLQMWLWVLVVFSFAFPLMPQSSVSVYNLVETNVSTNTSTNKYSYEESTDIPATTVNLPITEEITTPSLNNIENKPDNSDIIFENIAMIVYTIVATAIITVLLFSYIHNSSKLRKGKKINDAETLDILYKTKEKLCISRNIAIYYGESPMLCGLFKPALIIPEGCDENEQKFIITHELCHLKHNDILLIWLSALLLCVFWFNPIIWICFFVFRKDVEVYCDERVLKITDGKKEYTELLLRTALKKNKFAIGTTSLQNGEKEVERRIKHIAFFKKPGVVWTVVIAVIALVIGVVFLTNAKDKENYVYDFNYLRNPREIYIYDADLDLFNKFREYYDYDYMMNRCKHIKCCIRPDDTENIYVEKENSLVSERWKDVRVGIGYPLKYEDFLMLTDENILSDFLKKIKISSGKIYDIAIFDNIDKNVKYCIWVNADSAEYIIRVDTDGSLIALINGLFNRPLQTNIKVEKIEKNTDTKELNIPMSDSKITEFTKRIVGSVMAEIDYADDRKIVFHYIDSLFVYDYVDGKMLHTFDLSKLSCNTHGQGDSGINISVHTNGNYAYLWNYGPEEQTKKLDNYLFDFTNGTVQTEPFAIVKSDTVFKDTFTTVKDAKGWFSDRCISYNDKIFYLTTETSVMAGLKLCIKKDEKTYESMIFDNHESLNVFMPTKSKDNDLAIYMLKEFMKITLPENSFVSEFEHNTSSYIDEFGVQTNVKFHLQAYIPPEDYDNLISQLDATMTKLSISDYSPYDDLRHVIGWWLFDPDNLTARYNKTIKFDGYGPRINYIDAFITKHNDGYLMYFAY